MSVNKHLPHVLVLPEDRANSQIANGFLLHRNLLPRALQVLEEAGGWTKVVETFKVDHVVSMSRFQHRHMVLLVDFDKNDNRRDAVRDHIPEVLRDRVFIFGAWDEPEKLNIGSFETIGQALAEDGFKGTNHTWNHEHLRHNSGELERFRRSLRDVLFKPASAQSQ